MKKLLFCFFISITFAGFSQCYPSLEGDTIACPGIHIYTTDQAKTGYYWRAIGGSIIGDSTSWSVYISWKTQGILRVTYSECENPGVLIMAPCYTSIDEISKKENTEYFYFDLLGRSIPDLSAYKGIYVRTNFRKSQVFSKP